jgi:hypothetical protein
MQVKFRVISRKRNGAMTSLSQTPYNTIVFSIRCRLLQTNPDWINASNSRMYDVLFYKDLYYLKVVRMSGILMLSHVIMVIFTHF